MTQIYRRSLLWGRHGGWCVGGTMPLTHEYLQNHQHPAGRLRFVVLQSWVLEPPAKSVTQGLICRDFVALLTYAQSSWSLRFQVGKLEGHPMMKAGCCLLFLFSEVCSLRKAEAMGIMSGRPHPEASWLNSFGPLRRACRNAMQCHAGRPCAHHECRCAQTWAPKRVAAAAQQRTPARP